MPSWDLSCSPLFFTWAIGGWDRATRVQGQSSFLTYSCPQKPLWVDALKDALHSVSRHLQLTQDELSWNGETNVSKSAGSIKASLMQVKTVYHSLKERP